jgi:hypothetical protein
MVKNGQKLPHDVKKCPNYSMMVKNGQRLPHDGQNIQKLQDDGQKWLKTNA